MTLWKESRRVGTKRRAGLWGLNVEGVGRGGGVGRSGVRAEERWRRLGCQKHDICMVDPYYAMQRAKGKGHHAAVRALAFKWIRIIWKCWQTRTPYSEVKYLESLRKKLSPLLAYAAAHK